VKTGIRLWQGATPFAAGRHAPGRAVVGGAAAAAHGAGAAAAATVVAGAAAPLPWRAPGGTATQDTVFGNKADESAVGSCFVYNIAPAASRRVAAAAASAPAIPAATSAVAAAAATTPRPWSTGTGDLDPLFSSIHCRVRSIAACR